MTAAAEEFTVLFRNEYAPVLRTAYLLVGDRAVAEEITQEAFTRLYVHWKRVSRYERPGAWVRRVAIRLATGMRARRRAHPPEPPAPPGARDLDLHRAILTLPRRQRAAVVLHYFEDRPVTEVGRILGCSESTAKVHLHRARKRLAQVLSEEAADVP